MGDGSQSVITGAVGWLQAVLLGRVATAVAVIAVAGVGFALLTGRISPRRGLEVALGCFILFGAPVIAAALRDIASGAASNPAQAEVDAQPIQPARPNPKPTPYDPYAGAAVPQQR